VPCVEFGDTPGLPALLLPGLTGDVDGVFNGVVVGKVVVDGVVVLPCIPLTFGAPSVRGVWVRLGRVGSLLERPLLVVVVRALSACVLADAGVVVVVGVVVVGVVVLPGVVVGCTCACAIPNTNTAPRVINGFFISVVFIRPGRGVSCFYWKLQVLPNCRSSTPFPEMRLLRHP